MLEDVLNRRAKEADFIAGAILRRAAALGSDVPLAAAVHRLIKAKEASWTVHTHTAYADGGRAATFPSRNYRINDQR
jgi:hypothetical protein